MSIFMVHYCLRPDSCLDGFILGQLVLFFCVEMLQGMYGSVKGFLTVTNGLISTYSQTNFVSKTMLVMPIISETGIQLR